MDRQKIRLALKRTLEFEESARRWQAAGRKRPTRRAADTAPENQWETANQFSRRSLLGTVVLNHVRHGVGQHSRELGLVLYRQKQRLWHEYISAGKGGRLV